MPELDKDNVTPDPKGDEKTFTQADIDAAISKATESFKDFDKIKTDADEYSRLVENPRFAEFVEHENKRYALGDEEYEKMYGKNVDHNKDLDKDDEDDQMTEREKAMQAELNEIKESLAQSSVDSDRRAIQEEYKAISSDKKAYPLFDKSIKVGDEEVAVRELMARELDKAGKAGKDMTIAQAYREVTYDHQRELGRKDAEDVLAKKREAAKVGLPVSSPGRKSEGAKKFANVEDAVEATLTDLGL